MVFLIEYVATLATLFMLVGGFLFEATRQNAVSLLGVVGIAYICVFVLISSYILESLRFHAASCEDGIIWGLLLLIAFPFVRLLESTAT